MITPDDEGGTGREYLSTAGRTPLEGVRVVEISDRIAGAYCGKLLVDAGADVLLAEPDAGNPLRGFTASNQEPAPGSNAPLFDYLHAGKRAVDAGSGLAAVLGAADIVIVTATRSSAQDMGIDPERLLRSAPRSVIVTISDFGWSGPWAERAASELTLQAWSGAAGYRGRPDGPPIAVGGMVGEYMAGVLAAYGALAVRRRVLGGGPGEHLDLSMLEAMTLTMQSCEWLHAQLMLLPTIGRSVEVPSIERAKDGYVGVSMVTGQQWLDFTVMVECPELGEERALRSQLGRWEARARIEAATGPWFAAHTVEEIVDLGTLFRLPLAPIGTGDSITEMDHLRERGSFVANPAGFSQPRPPWRMSACVPAPVRPAPKIGDDALPGWQPREAEGISGLQRVPDSNPTMPLRGLRIVDLTAFWAGPSATHLLAGFGADVIKIESIQRPDGIRYSGGLRSGVPDWWEYGWLFQAVNTNKRSVTLNLESPEGKELFGKLVADADVVIENFSPRVMESFGLDQDALLSLNPHLVVVRMPAFGLDGPWRNRVGFAPTMEQIAGLAWVTGQPEDPPTAPRGVCDPLAGAHAAFALLAALEYTGRTGTGQLLEVPMIEAVLNVTAVQVMEAQVCGVTLGRRGSRGHEAAVQNIYRCYGHDDWIAVTVGTDDQWRALMSWMGRPAWSREEKLSTAQGRRDLADQIDRELADLLVHLERDRAVEEMASLGIPAAPVVAACDVTSNPQLLARGFFERLDHPRTGSALYPRPPFARLRGQDGWLRSPAPTLGQHNREVLGGLCGLDDAALDALVARDVIGDKPSGL